MVGRSVLLPNTGLPSVLVHGKPNLMYQVFDLPEVRALSLSINYFALSIPDAFIRWRLCCLIPLAMLRYKALTQYVIFSYRVIS